MLCSARARHRYQYASRLAMLICIKSFWQQAVHRVCWSGTHLPSISCLNTFASRSFEVRLLLLDLDLYGGTDPLGMFIFFNWSCPGLPSQCGTRGLFVQVVYLLTRYRLMLPPFRKIELPPLLPISDRSKHQCCLECMSVHMVLIRLGRFPERSDVLPTTLIWKCTSHTLSCVSRALRSTLESGQEAMVRQIDFSTTFDSAYWLQHHHWSVNRKGIL